MKNLILFLVLIGSSQAYSQSLETQVAVCDDGDYHLTIQSDLSRSTIKMAICEFTACADSEKKLVLASSGLTKQGQVVYASNDPAETYVVTYLEKQVVAEVLRTHDGHIIQGFNNCH